MSNATADLLVFPYGKGGRDITLPVDGGSTIYKGTLVAQLTATGMLVPASTSGSGPAIGVASHGQDNADGADLALRCTIETDRIFLFANGASTDACSEATLIGSTVYALDDHTVADNDNSGTLQAAGIFLGMEPESGGKVRVFVSPNLAGRQAATVAALTDNSAGTANNTIQAMPDPTDTPATADALRDDLVAVLLPALRNNVADLAAKINEIRTVLRAAGLMA